jgi:hypothetical protein
VPEPPGHAPRTDAEREYPPTSQFPAVPPVNYAPPGQAPDYGQGHQAAGYPAPGYPPPGQPPQGQPPQGQPPQGYPPPGYAPPGYPPPGYSAQQPYQPYPAQPGPGGRPPRKSSVPIIAVIVAVALLLCAGVATAGVMVARGVADKAKEAVHVPTAVPELPGLPTDLPSGSTGGREITVTYEVTGDGPAQILYLEKVGETPVRLQDVSLPWRFTTKVETPALLMVSAIRVDTDEGTISCRALVDGHEVKQRTSDSGNFGTASCTHFALD